MDFNDSGSEGQIKDEEITSALVPDCRDNHHDSCEAETVIKTIKKLRHNAM